MLERWRHVRLRAARNCSLETADGACLGWLMIVGCGWRGSRARVSVAGLPVTPSIVCRPLGTMFASNALTEAPNAAGIDAAAAGGVVIGTNGVMVKM